MSGLPAEVQRAAALWAQGLTLAGIASKMKVTPGVVAGWRHRHRSQFAPRRPRTARLQAKLDRLYDLLRDKALANAVCPSNDELGQALSCTYAAASILLAQLECDERIRVQRGPGWRIVAATDAEWTTAQPLDSQGRAARRPKRATAPARDSHGMPGEVDPHRLAAEINAHWAALGLAANARVVNGQVVSDVARLVRGGR